MYFYHINTGLDWLLSQRQTQNEDNYLAYRVLDFKNSYQFFPLYLVALAFHRSRICYPYFIKM